MKIDVKIINKEVCIVIYRNIKRSYIIDVTSVVITSVGYYKYRYRSVVIIVFIIRSAGIRGVGIKRY